MPDGARRRLPELRRGYLAAHDPEWRTPIRARCSRCSDRRHPGIRCTFGRAFAGGRLEAIPATRDADPLRARFLPLLRGRSRWKRSTTARLGVSGAGSPRSRRSPGAVVRPVPRSHRRPARWRCCRNLAQFASGEADERFAVAHTVWPLAAQAGRCCSPACSTTSPGPRRRPFRTRRARRARILRGARAVRGRHRAGRMAGAPAPLMPTTVKAGHADPR